MRIATMTSSEPALRTAYLMVHDEMERGLIPVVAKRLQSVRRRPHRPTLRGRRHRRVPRHRRRRRQEAVVVDENEVSQSEALALIDRAIRDATNGRLGGPVTP